LSAGARTERRSFYHDHKRWRNIADAAELALSVEFEIAPATEARNWLETGGAKVQNIVASATRAPKRAR